LKKNFLNQEGKKKHLTLRILAVLFLALGSTLFTPTPAHAEPVAGLTQDVYTYDSASTPDRTEYTLCNTGIVPNINFDVGGDVVANCQQDFVLIHWYGYITLPADGEITFQSFADDGFYLEIDGSLVIDDWVLKGCGGSTGTHTFQSGVSQKVDIWWYEYGGGACNLLYYIDPVSGFTLMPDSVWSTEAQPYVPPVVTPTLSKPVGLNGVADGTNVDLVWASIVEETQIERYAVTWTYAGADGWGLATSNQSITIGGLPEDTDVIFRVRSDNDTLGVYSEYSDPITVHTGFDPIVVPPIDPPVDPVDPPVVDPVDPEPPVVPEPPIEPEIPDPPVIPEPPVVPPTVPTEPEKPIIEPPVEEPTAQESLNSLVEIAPSEMTEAQVEQLQEAAFAVLENTEQGSPEYEAALDALFIAAQADDIEVSEELAAIPVLGNVAVGITNAINFLGNVGSDMSPKVREESKKIVVSAVVVAQVATTAVMATASVGAGSVLRRKP
jgi:hypothetical protein